MVSIWFYAVVVQAFFCMATHGVASLWCETANSTARGLTLSFPLRSAPGLRSAISADQMLSNSTDNTSAAALSMVKDTACAPIVVQLTRLDTFVGNVIPELSQSGFMVSVATIFPSEILLKGAAVAVVSGKAVFSNLIPTDCTVGSTYTFSFSLRSESGRLLDVDPLYARVLCRSVTSGSAGGVSRIALGSSGFLTRTTAPLLPPIPSSVAIPTFSIEVFSFGGLATSTADVDISVSFGGNESAAGSTKTVKKLATASSVAVDGLVFTPANSDVAFTTLVVSSAGLASLHIPLRVIQANLPNVFMRFASADSSITQTGQALKWVAGVRLQPIRIEFLNSKGDPDTSASGIVVVAQCAEAPDLSGTHASSVQGVATFDALMFSSSNAPLSYGVITFTAATSTVIASSVVIAPPPLHTGAVSITSSALRASQLAFGSRSSIRATTATTTVVVDSSNSFTLTNVIVLVLDSTSNLDTTANSIIVQLQLTALGSSGIAPVVSSGGTATVTNGVAVFTSVVCNNGGEGATIRVCVNDPTGEREQICSGTVKLSTGTSNRESDIQRCASSLTSTSADCLYSLSWGASPWSYVYYTGQPIMATVGGILPNIQVKLRDSFGDLTTPLPESIVPIMVAYTGSSPSSERYLSSEGRVGLWMHTSYVFSCLRFARKPPGSVTLNFVAVKSLATLEPYAWLPKLSTGYVRVATKVTGGFGLRFASSNQVFAYAGQSSTAVIGVALPSIQVEIVDSNHVLDGSISGIIIDAVTSSGELRRDGSSEVVTNGVATFRLLTFASGGLEPVLTFRVRASSLSVDTVMSSLSGVSISTGSLLVTEATIPAASIVFLGTSLDNNVTRPYQSFLFDGFGDATTLKVAVAITDSAHVISPTAERTVTIKQFSPEAVLASNQEVTISQGSPSTAFFDALILSYQSGFAVGAPPIFIQFVVSTPTSSPILVGSTIVVGPIFVATELARTFDSGAQCLTHFYSPMMVVTMREPLLSFNLSRSLLEVSQLLAIPSDKSVATASQRVDTLGVVALQTYSPSTRIVPMAVEGTASSDAVTLTRWVGTKVTFAFRDSLGGGASSSVLNDRSPRELALALTAYRPTCTPSTGSSFSTSTSSYTIQQSSHAIDDATCVVPLFQAAIETARNCSQGGYLSKCQCFALYAMNSYGGLCAMVPSLSGTFITLCQTDLAECSEPSVVLACTAFAAPEETSTVVYLALLALIVLPIAGAGYYLYRRASSNKTLLSRDRQVQQDEVRESLWQKISRVFKRGGDIVGV